jgi:poly(3-hydroxybutyrate) depolymerase
MRTFFYKFSVTSKRIVCILTFMKSIRRSVTVLGVFIVGCGNGTSTNEGAGGALSAGGSSSVGGTVSVGGATTTSASTVGAAVGGNTSNGVGGSTSAAGGSSTLPTGGKSAAGGSTASTSATGGKSTAGGSAAGGKSSTSGTATGGKSSAGGSTAGGTAAGGKSSTGGTTNGGSTGTTTSPNGNKSAGCGKAPGIASSKYNNGTSIDITAAGMQRRYVLQVPTNYDNTHPYKHVVTLHARDGNDKQMYDWKYYGLLAPSNNEAIFVAPNGQLNGKPCAGTSSSGEASCGWPNTNGQDLALVDAVVAQTLENFCIDTDHIFATGWSYGGSMSYEVACERPLSALGTAGWGVRAIAIYAAAQLSGSCKPKSPVAYYHSHGTSDSVLNYDSMGMPLAKNFASANGCTWKDPTKVTSGSHVCTNMTGCKADYPLEFCSFKGDHTPFPDTGQSSGSWGPQEAWKFLSQF